MLACCVYKDDVWWRGLAFTLVPDSNVAKVVFNLNDLHLILINGVKTKNTIRMNIQKSHSMILLPIVSSESHYLNL